MTCTVFACSMSYTTCLARQVSKENETCSSGGCKQGAEIKARYPDWKRGKKPKRGARAKIYGEAQKAAYIKGFSRGDSARRCSIEGCNNPHQAKGFCAKHYWSIVFNPKNRCKHPLCDNVRVKGGMCKCHSRVEVTV